MGLTDYVTLGNSGLRVSPLCLGTMTFGEDWGVMGTTPEESRDVLGSYLDRGGNFLDTANVYTKGHSEKIIGDYFADRGGRDRVVIATKFCGNMHPGDPNGGGSGRKAVVHQVEDSLRRLKTDYIDLLWAHFWDRHTPIEETVRVMDDLVRAGKVRHLGLSDHPAWVCARFLAVAEALGREPVVAVQLEYSLAQRTVEDELLPMARHLGLGVTPWSPLRGGVLSGKFKRGQHPGEDQTRVKEDSVHLSEKNYGIIDVLGGVAEDLGASVAQVALNWVQSRDGVTSTIIGAKRLSQLEDNLAALDITLGGEHTEKLDAASAYEKHFPQNFLERITPAIQNGAAVNGVASEAWAMSPKDDGERH